MEDDLTVDGGHTMQYSDHVSETYTRNLYGTPTTLILKVFSPNKRWSNCVRKRISKHKMIIQRKDESTNTGI